MKQLKLLKEAYQIVRGKDYLHQLCQIEKLKLAELQIKAHFHQFY